MQRDTRARTCSRCKGTGQPWAELSAGGVGSTHCWDSPHLSIQRSPLLLEAGKGHVYEFPERLSLCSQGHLEERKTGSVPTGAARGTALSQGYEPCRVWGTVPYLLLDGSCQQCAQLLLQLQALRAGTNLGSSVGAKRLQETVTLQRGGTAQGTSPPIPGWGQQCHTVGHVTSCLARRASSARCCAASRSCRQLCSLAGTPCSTASHRDTMARTCSLCKGTAALLQLPSATSLTHTPRIPPCPPRSPPAPAPRAHPARPAERRLPRPAAHGAARPMHPEEGMRTPMAPGMAAPKSRRTPTHHCLRCPCQLLRQLLLCSTLPLHSLHLLLQLHVEAVVDPLLLKAGQDVCHTSTSPPALQPRATRHAEPFLHTVGCGPAGGDTHPPGPGDISLGVCIPLPRRPHSRERALAVLPVTQLQ